VFSAIQIKLQIPTAKPFLFLLADALQSSAAVAFAETKSGKLI